MKCLFIRKVLFVLTFLICITARAETNFDHDDTGFPLTGQHSILSCESCHLRGVFKGIPDTCEGCHEKFQQIGGSMKPPTHVKTNAPCDDCHTDNTWTAVRMDHADITADCVTCHNNTLYEGKPNNHVQSSDECDTCHLTVSWTPARFDHFGITDNCFRCHNGTDAIGKNPASHPPADNVCEDCHTTNGWIPARYDHTNITDPCITCHNGTYATPKNPGHYQTSDECDLCHYTTGWKPAFFDHSGATGSCSQCHNNVNGTGYGSGHLNVDPTDKECDVCHYTTGWTPIRQYNHDSVNYPGEHTGVTLGCYSCHRERTVTLGWVSAGYWPDCAACHAKDFANDKHEGLTVNDIPDCAGTCHKPSPQHHLYNSSWEN